jgi:hypothetical protein|tara:strand:- start:885 stop:1364 length:480 start_codon:yes stop_codon:yes gene_type:complete
MELAINGPVTERQERMLRRAVDFFLNKLMTTRLQQTLYIEMDIIKDLEATTGNCGTATWEDANVRPKDFTVEASWNGKKGFEKTLETIAHELVHVKQFARGEMKDLMSVKKVSWNGTRYDRAETDYWDLPWEIEAHGRERGLFVRLCEADPEISKYCGY